MQIGPRLERLYGTVSLSEMMQAHGPSISGRMYDIHDSPSWNNAFSHDQFCGDSRGIALSLCTDGVNPYSVQGVSYSMWPIMLTILNLPRHIRNLFTNIILAGIIPSNGSHEPKQIAPYLELVVHELLMLANSTVYDAYQSAPFKLKIHILSYVLDYPGVAKVFSLTGTGAYKACVWCDIKGLCGHL